MFSATKLPGVDPASPAFRRARFDAGYAVIGLSGEGTVLTTAERIAALETVDALAVEGSPPEQAAWRALRNEYVARWEREEAQGAGPRTGSRR